MLEKIDGPSLRALSEISPARANAAESLARAGRRIAYHVPIRRRATKLGLSITLDATPSARGIALVVEPLDEADRITARRSRLIIELWHETPNLIRGTISHASGASAHFQGGKPLADFARALQLRIEHDEEVLP